MSAASSSPTPTPSSYKNAPICFVSVQGVNFAYRQLGPDDVPLILLNHLSAVLDNWDPRVVDGLAARRRVITYDNRGVGASGGSTPDRTRSTAGVAQARCRRRPCLGTRRPPGQARPQASLGDFTQGQAEFGSRDLGQGRGALAHRPHMILGPTAGRVSRPPPAVPQQAVPLGDMLDDQLRPPGRCCSAAELRHESHVVDQDITRPDPTGLEQPDQLLGQSISQQRGAHRARERGQFRRREFDRARHTGSGDHYTRRRGQLDAAPAGLVGQPSILWDALRRVPPRSCVAHGRTVAEQESPGLLLAEFLVVPQGLEFAAGLS
ncbi:alpha/beta fold hydrolase [Streptomyces anulatus]|uniref:alpha/beta fold hydrolase n=1 Tax=Streptomyces anulatus TaxID=1892 RepID=UPI00386CD0DC